MPKEKKRKYQSTLDLNSTQAITDTRVKYSSLANVNLIQPELIDSTVCEGQLNNIFRREVSWEIRIDHRLEKGYIQCFRRASEQGILFMLVFSCLELGMTDMGTGDTNTWALQEPNKREDFMTMAWFLSTRELFGSHIYVTTQNNYTMWEVVGCRNE